MNLVADRFVSRAGPALDLATGRSVRLVAFAHRTAVEAATWIEDVARLACLRHPALRTVVDYGPLDRHRSFVALDASEWPVAASCVRHARRFLATDDGDRPAGVCTLMLRGPGRGRSAARPLGLVLQPRRALAAVVEGLASTTPAGVCVIDVAGHAGSGLRTLGLHVARAARLLGFVPIAAGVLAAIPDLGAVFRSRHVVLLDCATGGDERNALASTLARLGTSGARRHVLIRCRRRCPPAGGVLMEPMDRRSLEAMVYRDRWCGPDDEEMEVVLRTASRWPGLVVRALTGATDRPVRRAGAVHETSAAYAFGNPSPAPPPTLRRLARSTAQATERASRLAARGRHAAAVRALERAIRVHVGRSRPAEAAAAWLVLGWLHRERGRTGAAATAFSEARRLAGGPAGQIEGAIGLGVIWTDEQRFEEAEAALRSAMAAADTLTDAPLHRRAALALGRCLYWQDRDAEALATLDTLEGADPLLLALRARIRATTGDGARAAAEANAAWHAATTDRGRAVAARAQAVVRLAVGDADAAIEAIARGVGAAARGHLPMQTIKLRVERQCALRRLPSAPPRAAEATRLRRLAASPLPPLLRRLLARVFEHAPAATAPLPLLRQFLDLVHSAATEDDAIAAVGCAVQRRLGASAVAVLAGDGPLVAWLEGRWPSPDWTDVRRAMASPAFVVSRSEPHQCGTAVCLAETAIGAIACRWPAGTSVAWSDAEAVCDAAALALAAPVRGFLERRAPDLQADAWPDLLGTGPATAALRQTIVAAARAPFPVLIEGESGSGKELVARAIHRLGPRRGRRLCALNCAAIADDLLESELFGHCRGAFTGAVVERQGLFEEADGGTLFLDEVGELSTRAQAKLLRVLQDGEVRRVGETTPRKIDARIVAATNRRLAAEAEAGRFRADLRFRLDVIRITVPPLRERIADIPVIAHHVWQEASARVGSRATLSPDTIAALARYDWPGNVRELQNAMATLAVHGPRRGRITPAMLPASLAGAAVREEAGFEAARTEFERRYVRAALARAGGHQARAARALGVTRQGFAKMLRRLQIERPVPLPSLDAE